MLKSVLLRYKKKGSYGVLLQKTSYKDIMTIKVKNICIIGIAVLTIPNIIFAGGGVAQ